jgi:hypothetical protein
MRSKVWELLSFDFPALLADSEGLTTNRRTYAMQIAGMAMFLLDMIRR